MTVHAGLQGRAASDGALQVLCEMRDKCPLCGCEHKPARDLILAGASVVVGYCNTCGDGFVTTAYIYLVGGGRFVHLEWPQAYRMHPDDIRALPGIPADFTFPF